MSFPSPQSPARQLPIRRIYVHMQIPSTIHTRRVAHVQRGAAPPALLKQSGQGPARVGLQHVCDLVVSRSCAIVSMRGQESLTVGTHRRLFVARRARRATRFRLFVWDVNQLGENEEHRPSLRRVSKACGAAAVRAFGRSPRWRTLPPPDHRKSGASIGASTRSGSERSM